MKTFNTDSLPEKLGDFYQELVYCALDSSITHELFEKLNASLGDARPTYEHSRRLMAPYLTMMKRGILIDSEELERKRPEVQGKIGALRTWFEAMYEAIMEGEEDPKKRKANDKLVNSGPQLKKLFYETMAIPTIWKSEKGKRKISLDRKALEKITKKYFRGAPLAKALMAIRDHTKTLEVLDKELWNGRFHSSYGIAGTETGRRNSSAHPLGYGGNAQNITKDLRSIFIPDPGFILVQADQAQAESRDVAYLSGDENYIKAVKGADLHTFVASMVWGFDPKRELAERKFYRQLTYRDICKRLGHGSNYYGTASTLAQQTQVELALVEDFQQRYHLGPQAAFPGIREWQLHQISKVQSQGYLETPFGRLRQFWGRLDDESTLREAIAFEPQSMTGERTSLAIHRLYWELEPILQLLQDGHDAVLFQVPETHADVIEAAGALLPTEVEVTDIHGVTRKQLVPWEIQTGFNWGSRTEKDGVVKNPKGLQ